MPSAFTRVRNTASPDTSRDPSPIIFGKLGEDAIRMGHRRGVVFFDDFTGAAGAAESSTAFAWVGGSPPVRWLAYGTTSSTIKALRAAADDEAGILRIDTDAEDDEGYLAPDSTYNDLACKISDTAGDNLRMGFEARVRFGFVTSNFAAMIGMRELTDAATLDIPNGGATIKVAEFVGFRIVSGDSDGLDAVHVDAAEVVVKEAAAGKAAQTVTADTWVKCGFFFDGEKVYWVVNGQIVNPNAGVLPAATNFPDAEPLMPFIGCRTDATQDAHMDIDWVKLVYQLKS